VVEMNSPSRISTDSRLIDIVEAKLHARRGPTYRFE